MHLDAPGRARSSWGWLVGACVVLGSGLGPSACTLILGEDAEQCSTTAECASLGPAFANTVCSGEGRCVPQSLQGGGGGGGGGAPGVCTRNSACLAQSGASLCREGVCVPLANLEEGCDVSYGEVNDNDDENTLVGLLAPRSTQGLQGLVGDSLMSAFVMARNDYAAAVPRTAPLAPIVIRCDESADPVRAVGHLVNTVGVKMVVGPVLGENFQAVVGLTRPKGVVLVSPTVDDVALAEAGQGDGLVWSCRTNREQVARYYPSAVKRALEVFRQRQTDLVAAHALVVVNRGDLTTLNFLNLVQGPLTALMQESGGSLRTIEYDWSSKQSSNLTAFAQRLIAEYVTGQEVKPNVIIFPTSIDSVERAIVAIDGGWPLGVRTPVFIVDEHFNDPGSIVTNDRAAVGRLLGVRPYRGPASRQAAAEYDSAYRRTNGSVPVQKSEYGFDCFYESLYALSAAAPRDNGVVRLNVGGAAFRQGVPLIEAAAGTAVPVGQPNVATFFQTLLAGASGLDLVGTTSALNFGAENYPVSAGELYCLSAAGDFCGEGTVFDAITGAPSADPAPSATCVCATQ